MHPEFVENFDNAKPSILWSLHESHYPTSC